MASIAKRAAARSRRLPGAFRYHAISHILEPAWTRTLEEIIHRGRVTSDERASVLQAARLVLILIH